MFAKISKPHKNPSSELILARERARIANENVLLRQQQQSQEYFNGPGFVDVSDLPYDFKDRD